MAAELIFELNANQAAITGRPLQNTGSIRIDTAGFRHKRLQLRAGVLTLSDMPQRSRPFADHLIVGATATRAADDGSKWICVFV
jgi:hypothetical protein